MSAFLEHIRGGDDIIYGGLFDPTQSASKLILWECDTTGGVDGDGNPISWVPEYKTAGDVVTALASNDLRFRAAIGLPFQEYNGSSWLPVTPETEFGELLVRSMTVEEHPNKPNAWMIQITESGMGNLTDDGNWNGAAQGSPAVSVNVSSRVRNTKAWRMNPGLLLPVEEDDTDNDGYFLKDGWELCDPDTDDMAGVSIDYNGNPKNISIEQNVITIEFIARSPYAKWDGSYEMNKATAYYDNARALGNTVGARNAEDLFGYKRGVLRTIDVAIQPLHHEFKRVIWTLVADDYLHADQQPWMNKTGVIATKDSCSAGTEIPNLQASTVWWSQPYLEQFSMGSNPEGYFPAGGWDLIWAKFSLSSSDYEENGAEPAP